MAKKQAKPEPVTVYDIEVLNTDGEYIGHVLLNHEPDVFVYNNRLFTHDGDYKIRGTKRRYREVQVTVVHGMTPRK